MAEVMRYLNKRLPADAVMTTGAGNASDWQTSTMHTGHSDALITDLRRNGFRRTCRGGRQAGAPERIVVYMGGDGDFLMNGQELATAVQYGVDPVFVIVDNGSTARSACIRSIPIPAAPSDAAAKSRFRTVARGLRRTRRLSRRRSSSHRRREGPRQPQGGRYPRQGGPTRSVRI